MRPDFRFITDRTERVAVSIYATFIRNALGTLRHQNETFEQAVLRRWENAPNKTRTDFRDEAIAALESIE